MMRSGRLIVYTLLCIASEYSLMMRYEVEIYMIVETITNSKAHRSILYMKSREVRRSKKNVSKRNVFVLSYLTLCMVTLDSETYYNLTAENDMKNNGEEKDKKVDTGWLNTSSLHYQSASHVLIHQHSILSLHDGEALVLRWFFLYHSVPPYEYIYGISRETTMWKKGKVTEEHARVKIRVGIQYTPEVIEASKVIGWWSNIT